MKSPQPSLPAPGPAASGGEFHIPSLDGIRAVSFMLVFLAHAGLSAELPGGFGVTIFFFLSGYLITTLLRLERERTARNSLRDFYLRRAFRIWPPFYTVLAVAIGLTLARLLPEQLRPASVFAQLAHVTNYWLIFGDRHGFPAGTVVYWSLAVEEHFYLVFPWLFILLQRWLPGRLRPQALILLGLCALVLLWRMLLVFHFGAIEERTSLSSDTRLDAILFGCVLALWGNPMFDRWRGSALLWRGLLLPLGCAVLALTFLYRSPLFRETLRYSLQGLGLVPLFVVAIRYPDWGPMRLLNWRPVRHVGLLSYSLYLCHQVILIVVMLLLPSAGHFIVGVLSLALALALATAILHWVERPSARMRKAWVRTTWLKPTAPMREEAPPACDTASVQL
jgi:peptidoglycan/LPS O-acetylase OafA/YrhL